MKIFIKLFFIHLVLTGINASSMDDFLRDQNTSTETQKNKKRCPCSLMSCLRGTTYVIKTTVFVSVGYFVYKALPMIQKGDRFFTQGNQVFNEINSWFPKQGPDPAAPSVLSNTTADTSIQ